MINHDLMKTYRVSHATLNLRWAWLIASKIQFFLSNRTAATLKIGLDVLLKSLILNIRSDYLDQKENSHEMLLK